MGSSSEQAQGPDLARGIPLAELRDDVPFAGHVDGAAVVLVRRNGKVYAIGGACSHYHAPLAGGRVSEHGLVCPLHHACFSLETGEALAAPALAGVGSWDTRVEGDRVYVGA